MMLLSTYDMAISAISKIIRSAQNLIAQKIILPIELKKKRKKGKLRCCLRVRVIYLKTCTVLFFLLFLKNSFESYQMKFLEGFLTSGITKFYQCCMCHSKILANILANCFISTEKKLPNTISILVAQVIHHSIMLQYVILLIKMY